MANVNSTVRLINAGNQHNFNFRAETLVGGDIKVSVEAEGVGNASDSVILKKGVADEGHLRFAVDMFGAQGFYFAEGTVRWDEPYRVIRFEGNLRLVNVAEVHLADIPILEVPN